MTTRADKFNIQDKKKEYYSDFLNGFDKNPVTGFLARVTNADSIKQSLRNIILTINGERFFDSGIGSKVNASLFELVSPITKEDLRRSVSEACRREHRAHIHNVVVDVFPDGNSFLVAIDFSEVASPEQMQSLELIVRRVR